MADPLPAKAPRDGIVLLDPRAAAIFASGAPLRCLATGARWSEGPVWIDESQSVLWSDIPNDRILRWSASEGLAVWQQGVEFTNGHARDASGKFRFFQLLERLIAHNPGPGQRWRWSDYPYLSTSSRCAVGFVRTLLRTAS